MESIGSSPSGNVTLALRAAGTFFRRFEWSKRPKRIFGSERAANGTEGEIFANWAAILVWDACKFCGTDQLGCKWGLSEDFGREKGEKEGSKKRIDECEECGPNSVCR